MNNKILKKICMAFEIRHSINQEGFTLVELLVASAISVIVVLAGTIAVIPAYQSTIRVVNAQQLRDEWSRITLLINADVSESCRATVAASTLSLRVIEPASFGSLADIDPDAVDLICNNAPLITYALDGQNLTRSGPAVDESGELDFGNVTGALIVTDSVTDFSPALESVVIGTSELSPTYQLELTRRGSSYSGDGATAASRPRVRSY